MNRTQLVMKAIGWQGGTVHQLCDHLGLDVNEFLYSEPEHTYTGTDYNAGLYWNTNGPEHQKKLQALYKGNKDYWIGVARSVELNNYL